MHALRLMGGGLFDEYPKLRVILGHLGEVLPFGIWRVDPRISKGTLAPKAKRPMSQYLRENYYTTTGGNFRTQAGCDTYEVAFTVGRVRFVLEAEQFLGVTVGDFQAVRFADGSLVEPSARLGHILEGVVHASLPPELPRSLPSHARLIVHPPTRTDFHSYGWTAGPCETLP